MLKDTRHVGIFVKDLARHRSPANFLVNLLAGLVAYAHQPKKPSLVPAVASLAPALIHN